MKLLFFAAAFLLVGSVTCKGFLPSIPFGNTLEKLVPDKYLEPLKKLDQLFQDFNQNVDMEKLTPALVLGGKAGLSVLNSIQKLITIFATGQYLNPLAIGGMAQQGMLTTEKVQEALQAAREIPLEIPYDNVITYVLNQMVKILKVVRCLQPLNCISFGK